MSKRRLYIFAAILAIIGTMFASNALKGKGYIKIDSPDAELWLKGGFLNLNSVKIKSGILTEVTAGTYRPTKISIIKQNGDDDRREINCYGRWGQLQNIKVQKNETVSLKMGQPFFIKPDISGGVHSSLSIGISLIGQAGESYSLSRLQKNGKSVPEPMIYIKNGQGVIVTKDKMAYG